MDHPLRTLLYELLAEPFLRLLQRLFGRKGNARLLKGNDVELERKWPSVMNH